MLVVLQMVTNLLLDQVTGKEGHITEPHGRGERYKNNYACRRWHYKQRRGATHDQQCRPKKGSTAVDANDNLCKSVFV
ncbi:MAG TPA: hypothetical protein VKT33_08260 [Candidatus Angelobacter sp.]|nr:hypothetical protein [Candidatus Angelobacter sp.]